MKKSHLFFYSMYKISKRKKRKGRSRICNGEMEPTEDEEKANMYLCLS